MVVVAARQIQDGMRVFVGMRLPLLAFALAKRTHAPHATGLFENGLARDLPAPELLYTMSDGPNVQGAIWATGMGKALGMLQQGSVDLGFIGGAEIDRFGNLNTSYVGSNEKITKLPGSGGACDIATCARKLAIIMEHEPRRFRPRVYYITSPGYGDGSPDWRERNGLPGGGPVAVITTLALLEFDPISHEAQLSSYHSHTTPEAVSAATGWPLKFSPTMQATPPPTADELAIIRECDPQGFWTS
jgi:glutaconate CoA-transferase subunit B